MFFQTLHAIGSPTCLLNYVFPYPCAANSDSLGHGYCDRLSHRVFSQWGKRNSDSIRDLTEIQRLAKILRDRG